LIKKVLKKEGCISKVGVAYLWKAGPNVLHLQGRRRIFARSSAEIKKRGDLLVMQKIQIEGGGGVERIEHGPFRGGIRGGMEIVVF
jgi:hypothetical protein